MNASTRWINEYLDRPADADEQAMRLTMAGFPIESRHEVDLGVGVIDTCQDVELTSNRGDCLCHVGLAREIAAATGRMLVVPAAAPKAGGPSASALIKVENRERRACPLYTARIIRGVKVGPSPEWLASRLRAIGQIPRNNIVDATNFLLFELGQPTHVFDLATIRGGKIVIRTAQEREPFLPLGEGEKEVALRASDLVIADAERAIALGGVKGGAITAVTNDTRDILIEAATFDPALVRATGRRLRIQSASAYRYERGVHPAHIHPAAERLTQLILELAGGTLCEGVVTDGAPIPPPVVVSMRPQRCRELLGIDVPDDTMAGILARLGFAPVKEGDRFRCIVPAHRLDVEREVDLVEEVGRLHGIDHVPVRDTLSIRIAPPQPRELARRAVQSALVGMGFVETVTHSLIGETDAALFLHQGEHLLRVDDERAKAEPILRPSLLPSLLRVRAFNRDRGVNRLRLFELAATFAQTTPGTHREERRLALLADVDDHSLGLRPMRGVIERLVHLLRGRTIATTLEPAADLPWMLEGAQAAALVQGRVIGSIGLIHPKVMRHFGLEGDCLAAEVSLEPFFASYPPETEVKPLPAFPAIERDVSAIVAEDAAWQSVRTRLEALQLPMLEAAEFVTTFRGKQVEAGKKSLTFRLRFRAPDRTLTHDEVDSQAQRAMTMLRDELGATIRA